MLYFFRDIGCKTRDIKFGMQFEFAKSRHENSLEELPEIWRTRLLFMHWLKATSNAAWFAKDCHKSVSVSSPIFEGSSLLFLHG